MHKVYNFMALRNLNYLRLQTLPIFMVETNNLPLKIVPYKIIKNLNLVDIDFNQ